MVQQERQLQQNGINQIESGGAEGKKHIVTKYLLEDINANGGTTRFAGHDSTLYSAEYLVNKKEHTKDIAPANNYEAANYALMIYDKKINGLRIVPIHKHISFEKQKPFLKKAINQRASKPQSTSAPVPGRKAAPKKDLKSFFKNKILQSNKSFVGGTKQETPAVVAKNKKKVKKQHEDQDSDSDS